MPSSQPVYSPQPDGNMYGSDTQAMEEAKTTDLKDFPDLGEDDANFQIEWDKSKYTVCITEWIKQGHVVYKLKGTDKLGDFDIQRRYNEFYVLRGVLVKRYPAFYIPPVPPKKAFGNKEEKYVQERWYMLNRFIQQCSALDFLWASDEMAAFLRPTMEVEKSLLLMSKLTTEQTLERILAHLSVDESTVGEFSSRYNEQINEFKTHTKKVFPVLE